MRKIIATKETVLTIGLLPDLHEVSQRKINRVANVINSGLFPFDGVFAVGDFKHNYGENPEDVYELINKTHLLASTIGNHEAYISSQALANLKQIINFICISYLENGKQVFPSYDIFGSKNSNYCVIGDSFFPQREFSAKKRNVSFKSKEEARKEIKNIIRDVKGKKDIEKFVFLSHRGITSDCELVPFLEEQKLLSRGEYVILGGHNHICTPAIGAIINNGRILHSGVNLSALGVATFFADKSTTLTNIRTSRLHEETLAKNFRNYPIENKKVGISFLCPDYFSSNATGSAIADAICREQGTDIAIINAGTIRAHINRDLAEKDAEEIVDKLLPFRENISITVEATKQQIEEIILREIDLLNERVEEDHFAALNEKLFLQVSGISYTVAGNPGEYQLEELTFHKEKERYTVTTSDFTWGVYGFEAIFGDQAQKTTAFVSETVENDFKKHGVKIPIDSKDRKRIINGPNVSRETN